MTIRVLIADDQPLVRSGFRNFLRDVADIEVVGEAIDGAEAVGKAQRLSPDVVVMDIRMPRLDGIEATREIVESAGDELRVLMLTTFGSEEYVYESLRAGASGFMLKDAPPEDLVAAIRTVAAGDSLLAPAVTRLMIEEFVRVAPRRSAAPDLDELTDREREVLGLITRGLSNGEIARTLMIGEPTVKTHVAQVLRKLDMRDRVQAVIYAYESGLVQPGESERDAPAGHG
jgi:DNA-binding NarL/FixJ family response regulator